MIRQADYIGARSKESLFQWIQSGYNQISYSADLEEHKESPESKEETNLSECFCVSMWVGEAWMMVPLPTSVHNLQCNVSITSES